MCVSMTTSVAWLIHTPTQHQQHVATHLPYGRAVTNSCDVDSEHSSTVLSVLISAVNSIAHNVVVAVMITPTKKVT